jgi:hypothetical protein
MHPLKWLEKKIDSFMELTTVLISSLSKVCLSSAAENNLLISLHCCLYGVIIPILFASFKNIKNAKFSNSCSAKI